MSATRSRRRSAPARRRAAARGARSRAAAARRARVRRWLLIGLGMLAVAVAVAVWRLDFGEKIQELTLPLRHDDVIRQEAADEDIARLATGEVALPPADPALLAAVIYAESRFRDQTSSQGARGLMQITPATADTIEGISGGETFVYEDLADPELNIRYGSFYLRYLLDLYEGNEVAALAAYNAGEGNAEEWGGASMEASDIGFEETLHYVEEVLDKRGDYREKYADELGL